MPLKRQHLLKLSENSNFILFWISKSVLSAPSTGSTRVDYPVYKINQSFTSVLCELSICLETQTPFGWDVDHWAKIQTPNSLWFSIFKAPWLIFHKKKNQKPKAPGRATISVGMMSRVPGNHMQAFSDTHVAMLGILFPSCLSGHTIYSGSL